MRYVIDGQRLWNLDQVQRMDWDVVNDVLRVTLVFDITDLNADVVLSGRAAMDALRAAGLNEAQVLAVTASARGGRSAAP